MPEKNDYKAQAEFLKGRMDEILKFVRNREDFYQDHPTWNIWDHLEDLVEKTLIDVSY